MPERFGPVVFIGISECGASSTSRRWRIAARKKASNRCTPGTRNIIVPSGNTRRFDRKMDPSTDETNDLSGLIAHCHRCEDGRRGDGYILRQSELLPFLRGKPEIVEPLYVVFGDSAYPNTNVMVSMFRGQDLPPWAAAFNKTMASVRISVEWGYAQVCSNFACVDWKRQLKIDLMPVEAIWHVGVSLTNCLTCHWGPNMISDYFACSPPTLAEYLEDFNFM